MMTLSRKEILKYEQKALEAIPDDHPHRDEIIKLLNEQVKDDLSQSDATHTSTNR